MDLDLMLLLVFYINIMEFIKYFLEIWTNILEMMLIIKD